MMTRALGTLVMMVAADGTFVTIMGQNTVNSSITDIATLNYLGFRSHMNDVSKRMGDLRTMPKQAGAWVRAFGGENKYGDHGLKHDYYSVQLGSDVWFDNFYFGMTASVSEGDGSIANGSYEDKGYSLGVYGGWLSENGQYLDVTLKGNYLDTSMGLVNTSGVANNADYDNWGTSVSVEYGWRVHCTKYQNFFVEPQVELLYGYLDKVNYKTSLGEEVTQDKVQSLIGRFGVAVGYQFPESAGSVYAKASVLHDWEGKVDVTARAGNQQAAYSDDVSGTWGEFVIGGTYNVTKNLSAYGEVQTTTGSPIENEWQASVGIRYNF